MKKKLLILGFLVTLFLVIDWSELLLSFVYLIIGLFPP